MNFYEAMTSGRLTVLITNSKQLVSLQVKDPINIKLSDYGISRQSFHEGALGVEGTPGYQAPEIRPGIVYDEKVLSASS